jgi:ATP-dependent helicase HrpB
MTPLPIDPLLPDLVASLKAFGALVLRAPTGAGKTTRVPPTLLDAGLADGGDIVMLEPRRLAARAAARRMSLERGSRLGEVIGYQVRFDRQACAATRIHVVTPGILLRRLQDDPFLEGTNVLVFDEFHERQVECDLALGIARLVRQTVRPDLKIVVMSATLEGEAVAKYLGDCPLLESQGRAFPVEVQYDPRAGSMPLAAAVAEGVKTMLRQTPGDLLVFLPGMGEMRQAQREIEERVAGDFDIYLLHGDLPAEQQDAALVPHARRKVVLATNVAETSVTVEGVTGVLDSGLARILEFDAHVGMDRLEVKPISKASADQRAGRAGRTQPGVCLRLWSENAQRARPEQTEPEIRRVDLAGPILELLCLGEDLERFTWLEAPRPESIQKGFDLLRRLGAVRDRHVTELGRRMAALPVHPRLARMLLEGRAHGQLERIALAAALLSERDPFLRHGKTQSLTKHRTRSDVLDRVEALEDFERRGAYETPFGTIHRHAARFILRSRDQLVRMAGGRASTHDEEDAVLRALLAGFPDRLTRRRNPGGRTGRMVGGRGVRLDNASGVTESELFLCIDVDAGDVEANVRLASAVQRDWLPADSIETAIDVFFDEKSEKVLARKRVRFEDLMLEESSANPPDDDAVARVLAEAAVNHWPRIAPGPESPAGQFLLRVRCLREWMPELQLPAFADADLLDTLQIVCRGKRSFTELRQVDWRGILEGRLTWEQRQAIEREAPERYEVPSGSHLKLHYELGRPPILAVRIQEMFGQPDTPRLAGGRVKVLLHLLAPNSRPQQVTDDLASFWANTYPHVRKELRARYPKHAWPDDPLTAPPQSRPGKKG